MNFRSSHLLRAAILIGVGLSLGACTYLREAAGMNKMAPDEFAVLTKAPLVIPPDYNLAPPKPGAAPTNQTDPTGTAQSTLFGNDRAGSALVSESEKALLASAGATNADSSVGLHIAADNKSMLAADDSFANDVMFWKPSKPDHSNPVDADAEAKKFDARKTTGQAPGADSAPPPPPPPPQKDEGDGWFDWLWPF